MPASRPAATEHTLNVEAIAALAMETHQPLQVVQRVFETELARLKAQARVTDYLVVFASRRTRSILRSAVP